MSFDCFTALVVSPRAANGLPLPLRACAREAPPAQIACRAGCRNLPPPPPTRRHHPRCHRSLFPQEAYQAQAADVPDDVEFPDLSWGGWEAIARKLNLGFLDPADAPLFRCAHALDRARSLHAAVGRPQIWPSERLPPPACASPRRTRVAVKIAVAADAAHLAGERVQFGAVEQRLLDILSGGAPLSQVPDTVRWRAALARGALQGTVRLGGQRPARGVPAPQPWPPLQQRGRRDGAGPAIPTTLVPPTRAASGGGGGGAAAARAHRAAREAQQGAAQPAQLHGAAGRGAGGGHLVRPLG